MHVQRPPDVQLDLVGDVHEAVAGVLVEHPVDLDLVSAGDDVSGPTSDVESMTPGNASPTEPFADRVIGVSDRTSLVFVALSDPAFEVPRNVTACAAGFAIPRRSTMPGGGVRLASANVRATWSELYGQSGISLRTAGHKGGRRGMGLSVP